jgi:esterase/lipase superfamily enzyme
VRFSIRTAGVLLIALALAACAGRPDGDLIPVAVNVPGASHVDMLVATTREAVAEPPGVMFNGERSQFDSFAHIVVSIPPDSERKAGDVQWPSSSPGDPAREFVTVSAQKIDLDQAKATFNARLLKEKSAGRHVLIFVHGYNTRFEEAVYRFAQIVHDSGANVVPVLFTWPSRGKLFDYVYDRDSSTLSRDALEKMLQLMSKNPNVGEISILAHSMGNFTAVEALRQMAIRNGGLPKKITDIMLASPDIDFDVFIRQIAEIEKTDKSPPVTLFVSSNDRALKASSLLAGGEPRLGQVNPNVEPYKSLLDKARVNVVDLSDVKSADSLNHSKFATSAVVKLIGMRIATGQTLTDSRLSLGERIGGLAGGAVVVVGKATTLAVSAPLAIVDPNTREAIGDEAKQLGEAGNDMLAAPMEDTGK